MVAMPRKPKQPDVLPVPGPQKRSVGRPPAQEETETISAKIPKKLAAVLVALARQNRRSKAAETIIALEDRIKALRAAGQLPPSVLALVEELFPTASNQ